MLVDTNKDESLQGEALSELFDDRWVLYRVSEDTTYHLSKDCQMLWSAPGRAEIVVARISELSAAEICTHCRGMARMRWLIKHLAMAPSWQSGQLAVLAAVTKQGKSRPPIVVMLERIMGIWQVAVMQDSGYSKSFALLPEGIANWMAECFSETVELLGPVEECDSDQVFETAIYLWRPLNQSPADDVEQLKLPNDALTVARQLVS